MPLLPGSAIFYKTKEQPARHHHYFTSFRGLQANDEGTSSASKSEAMLTKGQRASIRSSLRSATYPDPSSSSSGSSLGKCNKTATKADQVPHWTPLGPLC
jgi:hypothetical protein